ncbi:MAG: hypothetical protein JNK46_13400, partial [Methylobacteriaceae bacterium]|nr:hypothetical protein [Methylobacteriaceae bacterium]
CTRQAFRFGPNHPESTSLWRTRAGEACAGQLFPGPRTTLHGLAIERQAANGVAGAGVGSKLHYAYNPRPGFVGRDQFVMRIDYEINGQRGASRVRVDVEVQR